MTALHKHYSTYELIKFFDDTDKIVLNNTWYSMGITDNDFDKFYQVYHDCDFKIEKPKLSFRLFICTEDGT